MEDDVALGDEVVEIAPREVDRHELERLPIGAAAQVAELLARP